LNLLGKYWNDKPLQVILVIALLVRLLAAVYSKGYGMHDDHFGPIEQPYQIMQDYSVWEERGNPHGHSIIYPAMHYYLFITLESVGITDSQSKMFVVRLLHAIYSLLIVYFGYKIAHIIGGRRAAVKVGLFLALFWILPFLSVRNLIEMVSIPPLMAGAYLSLRENRKKYDFWLIGLLFALAFIPRYHTLMIFGGIWLVFLFRKDYSALLKMTAGFAVTVFLTQGIVDWAAWGYPFAAPLEYFIYNAGAADQYTTGPWYNYIILVLGMLIPPLSFFILFGYFRDFKKFVVLSLPITIFFVFHSYFPNKQERFIIPVVPLIISIGLASWEVFSSNSDFWKKWKTMLNSAWVWFWIMNTALLAVFTFTYSKKTRIEPLTYLSNKSDVSGVIIEPGSLGHVFQPAFYLNKKVPIYIIHDNMTTGQIDSAVRAQNSDFPSYAVFYGIEELKIREKKFEEIFAVSLSAETIIEPSLIDDILHKLNPKHNKNQTAYVYKVKS